MPSRVRKETHQTATLVTEYKLVRSRAAGRILFQAVRRRSVAPTDGDGGQASWRRTAAKRALIVQKTIRADGS